MSPAALAGVMLRGLPGERGMFTAEQVRAAINSPSWRHSPRSRLLEVENTTNLGGGAVWLSALMTGRTGLLSRPRVRDREVQAVTA